MSYYILFDHIFVLSYSTHIWNAYVAGNLLKIKSATLHELKSTLKIGYNWLHIWDYYFSAAEGARKLMKPKLIFASPGKTESQKSTNSLSF